MPVVRRTAVRSGLGLHRPRAPESLAAVHRLVVHQRVVAAVHRDEQLPLLFRPPLAQHPRHRVTRRARVRRVLVRRVGVLDRPALGVERDRTILVRRQALVIREVLEDGARVRRLERRVVERDHALDRALPVLGRRAAVRNARHAPLVVAPMARAAFRADEIALDREALVFRRVRRRCGGLRLRRQGRAQARKNREPARRPALQHRLTLAHGESLWRPAATDRRRRSGTAPGAHVRQ